jgi:hypothetical protein
VWTFCHFRVRLKRVIVAAMVAAPPIIAICRRVIA